MTKFFSKETAPLLLILAFAIFLMVALWILPSSASARICKPVVPQIVVNTGKAGSAAGRTDFIITYDEAGNDPFVQGKFADSPRYTFCQSNGNGCTATRMRFEARFEKTRYQSMQIRRMSRAGNPVVGGIRWEGPAYPDLVKIRCDLSNPDLKTACRIDDIGYSALVHNSQNSEPAQNVRRNDECQPYSN